jgi:hypothetical protein
MSCAFLICDIVMETPRDADAVRMKLREDLDKNNVTLYLANLENIIMKGVLTKINVALHVVNKHDQCAPR